MEFNSSEKIPSSFPPPHDHDRHRHHHHHHHHHHFFYISHHCPHHRSIAQPRNHSPSCSFSTSQPSPQKPEPVSSVQSHPFSSFQDAQPHEAIDGSEMMQDEIEKLEAVEEEEEEPIFVLTDEWRDFFAKSEAKRKLAKKQAKKQKT